MSFVCKRDLIYLIDVSQENFNFLNHVQNMKLFLFLQ